MLDYGTLRETFLSAPGDDLVAKLILQMRKVKQFTNLFGADDSGSWANYARFDWPVRMLPAINIFESAGETKSSDNGYLTGSLQMQIYWPAEFRRADLARVPGYFKGALENFFNSRYAGEMLDEIPWIQRDAKVYGLNEIGKTLTWSPNVEGINDGEAVPMTILDVQYRIDLRRWEQALEYMGRTSAEPFEISLYPLEDCLGEIEGVNDRGEIKTVVPVDFNFEEGN